MPIVPIAVTMMPRELLFVRKKVSKYIKGKVLLIQTFCNKKRKKMSAQAWLRQSVNDLAQTVKFIFKFTSGKCIN